MFQGHDCNVVMNHESACFYYSTSIHICTPAACGCTETVNFFIY